MEDRFDSREGVAASSVEQKGRKPFYGWVVVAACGVVYALLGSFGLSASQIAIPVMVTDPDIMMDRALVGVGFSVFILFQGLLAPVIGLLVEKRGAKVTLLCAGALLCLAGVLLANFCGSSTMAYFILFGVVLSFGGAMGSQVPCQTTVSTWFVRKRGLAMSLMMVVCSCLAFTIPIITNAVIQGTGSWASAFYLISVAALLGIAVTLIFVRNKPEDKGLVADGGRAASATVVLRSSRVFKEENHKTLAQAVKSPAFWLFILAGLPLYFGYNMQVSAAVLHFTGYGLDPTLVAVGVSVTSVSAIVARLFVAPLADSIEPARLLAGANMVMIASMCAAGFCTTPVPALMFVFYVCVGFAFGINIVCLPVCFANYFGFSHFPKIIGWALPIFSIVAGTIPALAGLVFNAAGSYNLAFFGVAVCCAVGCVCALLVRYPRKPVEENAVPAEGEEVVLPGE